MWTTGPWAEPTVTLSSIFPQSRVTVQQQRLASRRTSFVVTDLGSVPYLPLPMPRDSGPYRMDIPGSTASPKHTFLWQVSRTCPFDDRRSPRAQSSGPRETFGRRLRRSQETRAERGLFRFQSRHRVQGIL